MRASWTHRQDAGNAKHRGVLLIDDLEHRVAMCIIETIDCKFADVLDVSDWRVALKEKQDTR